ncbi:lef-2 [Sucra jujuba nucleopolyhedrovirus]|uniref:Lef-2 n=1 Tax=Sucra jujuba nucleopolyhedrovirus TaxID=1563660 RepID=A0A097P966_9ABAC|nr:lef-2 [Sucra jujuba nucleopolyhedrovirus]AIU41349.1 lef-2 [Sucra jujuba nucleopolyhedrovirus]
MSTSPSQDHQQEKQQATLELCEWTPHNHNSIDKTKMYSVPFEDFNMDVNCYTRFNENGQNVCMSGLKLYYFVRAHGTNTAADTSKTGGAKKFGDKKAFSKKSCRNVCFMAVLNSKKAVADLIKSKLKMPPCMLSLLRLLETAPRGNRFQKRFVFNCYVANLVTCTKCNKNCILSAIAKLYDHDDKCVREFESLMRKDNLYKPPNCVNMKKKMLCKQSTDCKGSNPLCNY